MPGNLPVNPDNTTPAMLEVERFTVEIVAMVPRTLAEWLRAQAAAEGLSMSAMIRHELIRLRSERLAA